MPYELEFYDDGNGREPVRRWLDSLSEDKRAAAMRGLSLVLAEQGAGVADSEYGKALGDGLYEFRLRHSTREIVEKFRPQLADRLGPFPDDPVLLRVFFHPHGDRLILLLGGYDKGKDPSRRRQRKEIDLARARLKTWRGRQRRGEGHTGRFRSWWIGQARRRP